MSDIEMGDMKASANPVETEYSHAVQQQDNAADPKRDVFVSANAGSGKTHVLVNRVTRILLSPGGFKPEKILCLTYTKTAASEMQTRLFKTLGEWSILDAGALRGKLDKLLGAEDSANIALPEARKLFAKALETPEGLKVQTIHAFCERLLSRFPIEAGILPGFDALDDAEARALQEQAWNDILKAAYAAPQSELSWALSHLKGTLANMTLEGLRAWMGYNLYNITNWEQSGGTSSLAQMLGVNAQMNEQSVKRDGWKAVSKPALKAAIAGLRESKSSKQHEYADRLEGALATADPAAAYEQYASIVLTTKGVPRTQIGIKDCGPAAHDFFGLPKTADTAEMKALEGTVHTLRGVKVLTDTRAVYEISREFAARYKMLKTHARALDFTDQIMLTRQLLKDSYVSDWVQYKLDGGIEHILVDEAQDTSAAQWDIVDVIRDMFTHDQERDTRYPRTMFAVGDEKQSIYSFQGADPALFIARAREEQGRSEYDGIRMRMSFRSAPDILKFVDEIFVAQKKMLEMFDAESLPPASDLLGHTAHRSVPGLIELWPLSPAPSNTQTEEAWRPVPLDELAGDSSRESLAREIALQVKHWLSSGELVSVNEEVDGDKREITRPMRAKDILILVRKRTGPFFNAVIRNLKREGVAVAGADRLVLSDSLAVKDLMSLARFCCLPSDDLALAEVLKGPLFSISEEALLELAAERKGRLWAALKTSPLSWAKDYTARLKDILKLSRRVAPYEFFEGVLSTPTSDGTSQLRLIYRRLSMEVADPLDAFLDRALAHQRRGAPSLQHFVQSFARDTQELKRELDGSYDEVRVMTVYGAKGLEAPVVILPDTSQVPSAKNALDSGMLKLEDGSYVRPGSAATMPQSLESVKDARILKLKQEFLRLFYVALTRAESRLLICGYFSGNPPKEGAAQKAVDGCWHDIAQKAITAMGGQEFETPFTSEEFKGYCYGTRPQAQSRSAPMSKTVQTAIPDWARLARPPAAEAASILRVTPSMLLAGNDDFGPAARSPLSQPSGRFIRGTLVHKLLELLPDVAPAERASSGARFLSAYSHLDEAAREDILATVMSVLETPEFAEIFALGSQAEISLAGHAKSLPHDMRLNAQIDRLAVTDKAVFIIDYKSNRPPPKSADRVSDVYLGQMAAYREMARTAFDGKKVVCALLWTDGPDLMILPDALLDDALEKIKMLRA